MHLSGSITALATPFTVAGEIDFAAWQALLARQVEGGTAAVVVAGSTGEAATLDNDEFAALIRAAVAFMGGRIPVLAGCGLSGTEKTISQVKLARDSGADVALVVTPPYVRPTQAGLLAHYLEVAGRGGLPVVLYNVPGRTGCDLMPSTVAELAGHPAIIGLKEARGDEERWNALYPLASPSFSLLSGDDPTFVRAMLGGADGVISVASNVLPATFARICRYLAQGDASRAGEVDGSLQGIYDFLGVEPNPIPVKALLQRQGIGAGLRLPLLELSATHSARADQMSRLSHELESQLQ